MPIIRYFLGMGALLIVALLASNWVWPSDPVVPAPQKAASETPVEQSIRIQSARKLPDKIEFDTNAKMVAPAPASQTAAAEPQSVPQAIEQNMAADDPQVDVKPAAPLPPKRQAKVRHRSTPRQEYAQQPDFWGPSPRYASASQGWPFRW